MLAPRLLFAACFAFAARADFVDVTTLGAKRDGSEDVSAIVNAATELHALHFPAGRYKVSKPLRLKHPVKGDGYSRISRVDDSRTWLVSDLGATNSNVGVVEFGGEVQVNVENLNLLCSGEESGILVTNCRQRTSTFISRVGVFRVRGYGLCARGGGSRPIFAQDMTIVGAGWTAPNSVGVSIDGVYDCRISNVEAMGVRVGMEVFKSFVYGSNLHLWTGLMGKDREKSDGSWWKGTRGVVIGPNAHLQASQIYPDTCWWAIEQRGIGGYCELTNLMYWDDGTEWATRERGGEFYHAGPECTGKMSVSGANVGMGAFGDAKPGWLGDVYFRGSDVSGVVLKSDYSICTNNLSRLCFGTALPDYPVSYSDVGWCKVADVLAASGSGFCSAKIVLDSGAAWRVEAEQRPGEELSARAVPLNGLCPKDAVRFVEKDGHLRVFVRNSSGEKLSARFVAETMTPLFRPLDHGALRTIHGEVRWRETLPL